MCSSSVISVFMSRLMFLDFTSDQIASLLLSQSLLCSIVFSVPWLGLGIYLSFCFLSILLCSRTGRQSPQFGRLSSFFFLFTITSSCRLILIFTPWEFFTLVLADDLSREFEWQQVFSSLQDSSQYSGRSQKRSSLDGPYSSS